MAELMPEKSLKLAVFISGRGSNMEALIKACGDENYPAEINLVLSNNPDAAGLETAKAAGIRTAAINHKDYATREDFEQAILDELQNHDIDLICLAGFMRILSAHFIESWGKPVINIHPSLLPDYKGLNTHERVLADSRSESGCTVHFVVPEVDGGEIIVQRRVPVMANDTVETLAARVLEQEHIAYPEAVLKIANSGI